MSKRRSRKFASTRMMERVVPVLLGLLLLALIATFVIIILSLSGITPS